MSQLNRKPSANAAIVSIFQRYLPFVIIGMLLVSGCTSPATTEENTSKPPFKLWVWMGDDTNRTDAQCDSLFSELAQHGIKAVLINNSGNVGQLKRYLPIAQKHQLEVHAWYTTMNRPGDEEALQHPDWYMVSREGKSCFDTRPYVGYYQWLCPNNRAAKAHIINTVERLAQIDGIASVHLDYIRFPDIYLPVGLQPKYDLKQTSEMPEFDFCYCQHCIEAFEATHHKDPSKMERPDLDLEWTQFRLNSIKAVVDAAYNMAHANNKQLTAAVFPYPGMAARMVRQRWDKWHIDEVLPMIYHNFYKEELDWIGYATQQGVADLKPKGVKLNTGLFVPALDPKALGEALAISQANGASGAALFDVNSLTQEHLEVLAALVTSKKETDD